MRDYGIAVPIDSPKTATRDDEGVVQRNESAFTGDTVAESKIIGAPDELCPVPMADPGPGLTRGSLTPLRKSGLGLKLERATVRNSRPSSVKSVSTNSPTVPSVRFAPSMWGHLRGPGQAPCLSAYRRRSLSQSIVEQ